MFYESALKDTQKCKWCISILVKLNDYSLQSTAGLKIPIQMFFWNCSEIAILKVLEKSYKNNFTSNFIRSFPVKSSYPI